MRLTIHALGLGAMVALAACVDTKSFNGLEMLPPEPAIELSVRTVTGDTFDLQDQDGRVVLLFFGYTNCPDICPTTLADWAKTRAELGRRADRVRFVFVSVDPERDTPEVADAYAKKFDSSFIGLSPDSASLERIRKGFRISSWREDMPVGGPYAVAHSAQSFLVDRKGMVRLIYPFGFTSSELAEDLRRLM